MQVSSSAVYFLGVLMVAACPVVAMAVWLKILIRDLPDRSFWWLVFTMVALIVLPFVAEFAIWTPSTQERWISFPGKPFRKPTLLTVIKSGQWRDEIYVDVDLPNRRQGSYDLRLLAATSAGAALIAMTLLLPVCLAARSCRKEHTRGLTARTNTTGLKMQPLERGSSTFPIPEG